MIPPTSSSSLGWTLPLRTLLSASIPCCVGRAHMMVRAASPPLGQQEPSGPHLDVVFASSLPLVHLGKEMEVLSASLMPTLAHLGPGKLALLQGWA